MMTKITGAIGSLFRRKEPQPPVIYTDQPKTIRHSSFEAQHQQQDGWLNANGRYDFRSWFNR